MKNLCRMVAEVLGVEEESVTPDTGPMVLSAWDSLNHMRLMVQLEEHYAIELSPDEVVSLLSVQDIAGFLAAKGIPVG